MSSARLTSKGQLVIPKSVRDSLHLKPGTDFDVRVEGSHIVLEARHLKGSHLQDWPGLNPGGVHLNTDQLCEPVADYRDGDLKK